MELSCITQTIICYVYLIDKVYLFSFTSFTRTCSLISPSFTIFFLWLFKSNFVNSIPLFLFGGFMYFCLFVLIPYGDRVSQVTDLIQLWHKRKKGWSVFTILNFRKNCFILHKTLIRIHLWNGFLYFDSFMSLYKLYGLNMMWRIWYGSRHSSPARMKPYLMDWPGGTDPSPWEMSRQEQGQVGSLETVTHTHLHHPHGCSRSCTYS